MHDSVSHASVMQVQQVQHQTFILYSHSMVAFGGHDMGLPICQQIEAVKGLPC